MSARTYADKLRLPQWQQKRLRIMERAGFACEHCANRDRTQEIHHKLYESGAEPWEYEDWKLECLCDQCHRTVEDAKLRVMRRLAELPSHCFITLELALERLAEVDFADFASAFRIWCWGAGDRQVFDETLRKSEEGQT